MPAASAASLRLMPESALAIASRRRATRVLASALASLRKIAGVRSLLMISAVMMPSIMTAGNHDLARLRNRSTATGVIFSARRYKKRMETIDDDIADRAVDFIKRQKNANKPIFVWVNFTHM